MISSPEHHSGDDEGEGEGTVEGEGEGGDKSEGKGKRKEEKNVGEKKKGGNGKKREATRECDEGTRYKRARRDSQSSTSSLECNASSSRRRSASHEISEQIGCIGSYFKAYVQAKTGAGPAYFSASGSGHGSEGEEVEQLSPFAKAVRIVCGLPQFAADIKLRVRAFAHLKTTASALVFLEIPEGDREEYLLMEIGEQ